jgi:hypothetical protein
MLRAGRQGRETGQGRDRKLVRIFKRITLQADVKIYTLRYTGRIYFII